MLAHPIVPHRRGLRLPTPYTSESARSKRRHGARGAACREAAQGAAPHRPTQSRCAAPNSPRRSNSPRPPTPAAAGAIRRRGAPLRRHRLRAGRAGTRLERAPRLPGVHLRMLPRVRPLRSYWARALSLAPRVGVGARCKRRAQYLPSASSFRALVVAHDASPVR